MCDVLPVPLCFNILLFSVKRTGIVLVIAFLSNMPGSGSIVSSKFQEDVTSLNDTSSTSMNASSEQLSQHKEKPGEAEHVRLTWRSWVVVLVTCFAQMAQVFVVAGSGQNITFIARDIGNASLAGWIIRKYSILLI